MRIFDRDEAVGMYHERVAIEQWLEDVHVEPIRRGRAGCKVSRMEKELVILFLFETMTQPQTTSGDHRDTAEHNEPLRVAVGSANKAKIKSVELVVRRLFGDRAVHVGGYAVRSLRVIH